VRGRLKGKEEAKKDSSDQGYSTIVISYIALSLIDIINDYNSPG
jgi:hypothetical protein